MNRRYFYYKTIAKRLGAKGKFARAKLPSCVYKEIEKLHPREVGGPAKVGYRNPAKRARV